ncbi:MAG: Rrf2 family transcriptional regulator [Planctomycetaceae bacterium]|nr:Rrf2 family transcriptional regulator [Planctomycetaceae bacterium]
MTPYGKVAQAAISAASLLAENFSTDGGKRLNSREIAEKRKLSQAIVAKVLTTLSKIGIVTGSPGPGGGYSLACHPKQVTLQQIVAPFERQEPSLSCPFGEGWCGTGPHCPLHKQLERLRVQMSEFLNRTTLASFQA